jgi:hypothetical protein
VRTIFNLLVKAFTNLIIFNRLFVRAGLIYWAWPQGPNKLELLLFLIPLFIRFFYFIEPTAILNPLENTVEKCSLTQKNCKPDDTDD